MPYFPIQASTLFIELRFVISVPQCNVWNKRVSLRNTGSHIHFLSVSSTDLVSSWNAIFSLRYSATVSTIGKDSGSISRIMAHKLWRKEHDLRPSPTKIQLFICNDTQNVTHYVMLSSSTKPVTTVNHSYATALNTPISQLKYCSNPPDQCHDQFTSPENRSSLSTNIAISVSISIDKISKLHGAFPQQCQSFLGRSSLFKLSG